MSPEKIFPHLKTPRLLGEFLHRAVLLRGLRIKSSFAQIEYPYKEMKHDFS